MARQRGEFAYAELAHLMEAAEAWGKPPWEIRQCPEWVEWTVFRSWWLEARAYARKFRK